MTDAETVDEPSKDEVSVFEMEREGTNVKVGEPALERVEVSSELWLSPVAVSSGDGDNVTVVDGDADGGWVWD